jgi:hypothetical protein
MKCKSSRRYDSRLSTLFFCTNIFVLVLESEKIEKEKDLTEAAKTQRSMGAPDSVRCARQAGFWSTGCSREFVGGVLLKITGLSVVHRTIR